jgi:serine/threonine-protein kinase
VILYELLAGQVPFPLESRAETTRNKVLLAHMETPAPDILLLRGSHMPTVWPDERRQHEMQVPQWLLDMIRKCIEKDPGQRFANGIELYEHILKHSTTVAESSDLTEMLRQENRTLREENDRLQGELHTLSTQKAQAPPAPQYEPAYTPPPTQPASSRKWVVPVALATLAALVAVFLVAKSMHDTGNNSAGMMDTTSQRTVASMQPAEIQPSKSDREKPKTVDTVYVEGRDRTADQQTGAEPQSDQQTTNGEESDNQSDQQDTPPLRTGKHYLVTSSKAYFHNQPDPDSRRDAYLTPSDEVMTAIDEQGDYVYIVFTNNQGQTSKGWVLKSDLRPTE